ncbi:chromatin assembly factor 1 protein [Theileria orientalis strain Shintoku]|uniref:Chromatin assembly factor 1 protein n=1 Tax=Theileria orientalis strain Shintoku TaxID=869250 RepID=J7M4J8_THEOR|nr:chromatin assembly factor 1 protein [Theileria orientalis strain Shintoku]BAM38660.1 chromatin assembly factor 1 protein [Theileria orientalis strain Shintoku]|eukprot:XP_009688961.1 chromatin assembly factor 1 protein [Theileria orientalis strain Shintoku]
MDERHNWIVNTRVLYDFISCIKLPQQPLCVDFTQTITHEESSEEVAYQQIACGLQYETKEDVSIYIIDVALPAEPLKEELRRYCKCLDYEGFPLPVDTQFPMYQCVAQVSLKADVNRILSKTKDDNVFLAAKTTDGNWFTSNKYLVHLYNLRDLSQESKNLEPVCKFEGHEDEGYGMAFDSGCSEIASCSEDGLMYIYDIKGSEAASHKRLEQSSSYSYKHTGGLNCIDYSKTNEKNCLVATEDGYTRKVEGAENSVSTTTLNPNVFASGSTKGAIHLWDQRILSDPLHAITVHKEPIVRLHFNQLNKSLISSGSEDLTICILDLDSPGKDVNGGELEEDEEEDDSPPELIFTHTGHQDKVYDFVWSKYTDNLIASVGEDYSLQLWQMVRRH